MFDPDHIKNSDGLSVCIHKATNGTTFQAIVTGGNGDFALDMRIGVFKEGVVQPAHTPVFQYLLPDGDRVVDLVARAQTSKQAIGYLVDYLEKADYLEKISDPKDGRAQIVRRTEKGRKVNRIAGETVQKVQNEWPQAIGEEKMRVLLKTLRELAQHFGFDYVEKEQLNTT